MRKVRVESIEDFDALPEGKWVELPEGIKGTLVFDEMRVEDGKILIDLPSSILRQFKSKKGDRLKARITGGRLIVEK